ncbi:PAS domain S-box-containing protein/diguanylate cyclase (GGDEF)-like protein [Aneurinibacillus soli]|uniref:Phytochrome-like protein cph2 n=1 Tax=Aneurinibacillus soli TaxID=1500254 RepID=A0A0U5B425_9BACL|nr:EAL domain-containing protein [Aneurinibacillus soli]PYE59868.1 PAS domain S-box-containing protein/diguanylate cyclase (GGDEF)-like protein [Aneurinibacillus soli]BAU29410.1 Phytochrome-like protein cph2 [Aneurinibacillus soli]
MIDNSENFIETLVDIKYALDQSSILAVTDANGVITYVNDKFCEISQYSQEELLGKTHRIINAAYHDQNFFGNIWKIISKGGIWRGEIKNKKKDGSFYWVDTIIVPFPKGSLTPTSYVSIRRDITVQKEAEAQVYRLAYYDPLTNLRNRRGFHEFMEEAVEEAENSCSMFATIFIDLDRFKHVNDTLGHKIGDGLLEAIACRMEQHLESESTAVFRIGGDEFTVVWSGMQYEEDARQAALHILELFKAPFDSKGYQITMTPSLGISVYPLHGKDAESLLRRADTAMYCAKDKGENRYEMYTIEMEKEFISRLTIEQELRRALKDNNLYLHYQPKIDIKTGEMLGVEALLRWNHPDFGFIPPDRFIPIAENVGLIIPLGEWVIRTACKQNKKWQDQEYAPFVMSVNLSTLQFKQENLVEMIADALREADLEACWLEIEITESVLINYDREIIKKLNALKAMGIYISIDDFGTGYSSFNHLKNLPIDVVKIDRSFVSGLPNTNDEAIVSAIISMAHALQLKVLAEGVETEHQWDFLRQEGCHEGQGYLFSKPIAADEFEEMLRNKKKEHRSDI